MGVAGEEPYSPPATSYDTASAAVTANLASPIKNKGDATGDSYSSIENLRGSNFSDNLTGDNTNLSFPSPPVSVSLPPAPVRVSAPDPPISALAPPSPVSLSSKAEPAMFPAA
jgi:hypothetical protein